MGLWLRRSRRSFFFSSSRSAFSFSVRFSCSTAKIDAPPEHPMLAAVRNSSDPGWRGTFYFVEDPDEVTRPVEDLSE
jgi:hypothetical protein